MERNEYDDLSTHQQGYSLPCETDPDLWFGGPESDTPAKKPRSEVNAAMSMAVSLCLAECPDRPRIACMSLGLHDENLVEGVWGGLLPKDRQKIVDARKERAS